MLNCFILHKFGPDCFTIHWNALHYFRMNKHSCIILYGIKLLYTELDGISLHYAASHCISLLYTTLNYFGPFNFAYHFSLIPTITMYSLIPTITMYSSLTQSLAGIRQSTAVQNCLTQYNAVRCRVKQCIMQFHACKSSVKCQLKPKAR